MQITKLTMDVPSWPPYLRNVFLSLLITHTLFLMQISTNGFVSFAMPDFHQVTQFLSNGFPLIAPLSADFDFRQSGSVYYRVISENCTLMPVVADEIRRLNPSLKTNFQPTMCVVVTWFEAILFSARDQLVHIIRS